MDFFKATISKNYIDEVYSTIFQLGTIKTAVRLCNYNKNIRDFIRLN
jgi:hypothetical protein